MAPTQSAALKQLESQCQDLQVQIRDLVASMRDSQSPMVKRVLDDLAKVEERLTRFSEWRIEHEAQMSNLRDNIETLSERDDKLIREFTERLDKLNKVCVDALKDMSGQVEQIKIANASRGWLDDIAKKVIFMAVAGLAAAIFGLVIINVKG